VEEAQNAEIMQVRDPEVRRLRRLMREQRRISESHLNLKGKDTVMNCGFVWNVFTMNFTEKSELETLPDLVWAFKIFPCFSLFSFLSPSPCSLSSRAMT
jgi:hypothetical protein